MKLAVTGAAIVLALSTAALAQGGGYPASPSHGVMGTPNADGSPRYGREPGKPSENTIGNSSGGPGSGESESKGAAKGDTEKAGAAAGTDRR